MLIRPVDRTVFNGDPVLGVESVEISKRPAKYEVILVGSGLALPVGREGALAVSGRYKEDGALQFKDSAVFEFRTAKVDESQSGQVVLSASGLSSPSCLTS